MPEDNKLDESFRKMLAANGGRLKAIAASYADVDNREDLLQEMLYQLWRSFASFQGQSNVNTWVYRVALNTAITFSRQRKRQVPTKSADEHEQPLSNPAAPADAADVLSGFMHRLSKIDRAILILYLEDQSYRQIAEITGQTESNIGVRLNRIKAGFNEQYIEE